MINLLQKHGKLSLSNRPGGELKGLGNKLKSGSRFGLTSLTALLAFAGLSSPSNAQASSATTLLEGASIAGIRADGSLQVLLSDGEIILLRPGTYRLSEEQIYVGASTARTIEAGIAERLAAGRQAPETLDDLTVFTSAASAEINDGQSFIINVDANIGGDVSGVTYAIVGGTNASDFDIDAGTGVVTLRAGADVQNPNAGQNIIVRATSETGGFRDQTISFVAGGAAPSASNLSGMT